ncbi:MAG: radical SAM protein [Candidatus Delongbacteria bacterium]|nr:radical SAM protein [Candidatus Delongbacteria bacterium]MBN2836489.1 radical SAM protein [Candidatus Delongbacteria bacterium]
MFSEVYDSNKIKEFCNISNNAKQENVLNAINGHGFSLERAAFLLSPAADELIENMAKKSMEITRRRFGNIINIFTPMYLNNFCINGCLYCGFNSGNKDQRLRMSVDQSITESEAIARSGFRQILLVAGEDPKYINADYVSELSSKIKDNFSSIGIELQPYSVDEYIQMRENGVDYVAFYQETYNQKLYDIYHARGPKKDYLKRLNNLDNIGKASMSKIGMGILLGLNDYVEDMLSLLWHMDYIYKTYTFSQISVSFPRIQKSASTIEYNRISEMNGISPVNEKMLAKAMFAVRLLFNDASIVLSTRESAKFRDNMVPLVVTNMSAASKTAPGVYTLDDDNLDQFTIQDDRTLEEIETMLKTKNLESVMYERQFEKNW